MGYLGFVGFFVWLGLCATSPPLAVAALLLGLLLYASDRAR